MEFVGHEERGPARRSPVVALREAIGDYDMPKIPRVRRALLSMIRDPYVDFRRVVWMLERDPGLVAHLMQVLAVAGLGRRRISSIESIVSFIGLDALESLVIAASVPAVVNTKARVDEQTLGRFWAASARRALLAKLVADRTHPGSAWACYAAALLQDLALPILANRRPTPYDALLERWRAGEVPDLTTSEQERLGFDHAQVGSWVLGVAHLPRGLRHAILTHHQDPNAEGEADGEDDAAPVAAFPVRVVARLPEGIACQEDEPLRAGLAAALGGDLERVLKRADEGAEKLRTPLVNARLFRSRRRAREAVAR